MAEATQRKATKTKRPVPVAEKKTAKPTGAASALPPLYAKWIEPWLAAPIPEEKSATCSTCAMCPPAEAPLPASEVFFSPVTRCCTYWPDLANFLVGGILADDAPDLAEGRASVERRLDARVGVSPLGLGCSPVYSLLYGHGPAAFGRAETMECPHHLADGRCGVWRHREATCATWFCKHVRGLTGKRFWSRLYDLLSAAEVALARHCVLEIGLPAAALDLLVPPRARPASGLRGEELDEKVDPERYAAVWGQWAGHERQLYRRCELLVADLSFGDVLAIGGVELAMQAELTRAAFDRLLSDALPARARHVQIRLQCTSPSTAKVATYSLLDPLSVPMRLIEVLHRFDGRPTAEVLAEIEAEDGLRVTPGVVRKLADFGIVGDD